MNIQPIITRASLCLLAWCALAIAPTCAQTITHVPLYTFDGDSFTNGRIFSSSGAGDVNGDGFADLIVTAEENARVFSGSDGSILYNFNPDPITGMVGSFGTTASGAGDVNGDGFADLILGASANNIDGTFSGRAWVFSGSDGSVLHTFDGDSAFDRFGVAVSGAGDVNGDGFADLIVGATGGTNSNSPGLARVFSGSDGSVLYTFVGDSINSQFGSSVSGAGDVNDDGFADLIIGASLDNSNGPEAGRAQVFSGFDGSVLYTFDGDSAGDFAGDRFGTSVSGAGDVNGDGFADLIVGAPAADNNGLNSGRAQVFSGLDGSVLYNFDGARFASIGRSVSGAGDVNGDGFADLIVGIPDADNSPPDSGAARVFSGVDGSVLYNFDGDSAGDGFGRSVSGVGDVNGDGLADFIVSGRSTFLAEDNGYARVFVSQITVPFVLGDANLDGVVNFLDIFPFIELLSPVDGFTDYLEQADCNLDGVLSFSDIAPFLAILAGN